MKIIGLTGTIASGKSTVAKTLQRERKVPYISLDEIARKVVQLGTPTLNTILDTFGSEYAQLDGSLDRKKLGNFIFTNVAARTKLESITYPAIQKEYYDLLSSYQSDEGHIIIENALLFSSIDYYSMDGFIIVDIESSIQKNRLMVRNNFTADEAEARMQAQTSLASKVIAALAADRPYSIIENNTTAEDLVQNTLGAWDALLSKI